MTYATNPFVLWLLSRAYGQGGSVTVPSSGSRNDLLQDFPAGVDDVRTHLFNRYAEWSSESSTIEWCFLVGGPGNGKSEAMRDLAGVLLVELPPRKKGEPAPRTVPVEWPSIAAEVKPGLDIVFINDASIPRSQAGFAKRFGSLFLDITDGIRRLVSKDVPVIIFGNVNRGILVEERDSLRSNPPTPGSIVDELATELIDWLSNPPSDRSTRTTTAQFKRIETRVSPSPTKPYYGQVLAPLISYGFKWNLLVHVVFLDALSLLEPLPVLPQTPGQAIDFTTDVPTVASYQPFGSLTDRGATRDETIGGKLLESFVKLERWEEANCRSSKDGTLCEAFASCPLAQNARWLREPTLERHFLDTLRAAEISTGRRLTYRDLLSYYSLAILGRPESGWLSGTHPCQWVGANVQALTAGAKTAAVQLVNHRVYANLFEVLPRRSSARPRQGDTIYSVLIDQLASEGESSRTRGTEGALNDIDPARDVESWDGVRARVLDTVEALGIIPPSDQISKWSDILCEEVHSKIERAVDQVLRDEVNVELGLVSRESREASTRVQFLRKWRSTLLLRQVGLATGQLAFRPAIVAWLAQQETALRTRELLDLGQGIRCLVLPQLSSNQFWIAPLRPRTYNLNDNLPANTVMVAVSLADIWVEVVPHGDMLLADVQLLRIRDRKPPETVASLVIDLAIAREALLHVNGDTTSFTEIGSSAFARIERVRASLVGRERMKAVSAHFTDDAGRKYRISTNPSGRSPLRIQPL